MASLAILGSIFVVYFLGACRSVYVGDSGDLISAVYLLGIPHPTGYPLYVLLGKPWTLLAPVGSIASRMSLFSAFCAAAACAALYSLCRRMRLQPVAAATAALTLVFSASFWSQAQHRHDGPVHRFAVVEVFQRLKISMEIFERLDEEVR